MSSRRRNPDPRSRNPQKASANSTNRDALRKEKPSPWLIGIGLSLLVLLVFWGLFSAGFTWFDDAGTIWRNPLLNPPSIEGFFHYWHAPAFDLYVPLTYSVWNVLAWGAELSTGLPSGARLDPSVFHGANILLHLLAVLVAFRILDLLLRNRWAAAAGALVFALHPLQVEPVAWVSGLKDVLFGLLSLTAIWQYLRFAMDQPKEGDSAAAGALPSRSPPNTRTSEALRWDRIHYGIGVAAFILAMLAKPTAVVTPLLALTLDIGVLRRPVRRSLRALSPWFALSIPCILWTRWVQPAQLVANVNPWTGRPAVIADALAFYLHKLVWPSHLAIDYGRSPSFVLAHTPIHFTWIVPVAVAALVILLRKRIPFFAAGMVMFFLALVPVLGIVTFDYQHYSTVADHYLYLPMFGIALSVGAVLARWPTRPAFTLAGVCLLALGVRSALQTSVWQSSRSLFEHTLSVNPASSIANGDMAYVDLEAGDAAGAAAFAQRAVDSDRGQIDLYILLGTALARNGEPAKAYDADMKAADLALERGDADRLGRIGAALAQIDHVTPGDHVSSDAERMLRRSVELDPTNAEARLNLATLMARESRWTEALTQFDEVVHQSPDNPLAQCNRAYVLARLGRTQDAIAGYHAALRLNPHFPQAQQGLAQLTGATRPQ